MKRLLALLSLMALTIICLTCKKEPEVPVAQVKITEAEKVFESHDGHISAIFKGTYAYVGKIKGITLQIGTEEDMSSTTSEEAQIDETTFTVRVDGLTAETKYYYRYAVDYGGAKDYETEVKDFVTPALSLPTVTTAEVTEYTGTTAICGGTVTDMGGSNVTERGVCWSTDHNPTIDGDHEASSDEGNNFSVSISDLSPETTYYVRAYAVNAAGVGYGGEVEFTTMQIQGFLVAVSANPSEGGTVAGGGEFPSGDECTVTAVSNQGYTFANWTENGVQVSDRSSYTFIVNADRTLVAQFEANSYTISVSADPEVGGTVSGGGDFHYGENCTLEAVAAPGYRFVNWTKDNVVVYGGTTYTFQVTESALYVAHFQVMAFDLSVTANPTVIPKGGSSQLDAVASGGSSSFTYSWTPSSSLNNASIHNPTATPTATTTYTCTVTSGGQTGSGSCTVTVMCPPANLTAEVQNSNNVHLSWTAANPADSYKVYRDNTLVAAITATTYTDSNLGAGTYNYEVSAVYQDVESPKSYTAQATIYNSLSVTATANPSIIPFGSTSILIANATGGDGNYTYDWTPTTGLDNSHIQSPTTTTGTTRTYTVTVSSMGQTATAEVTVNVVRAPTGLTASVQNTNNVYLHWTAPDQVDSYNVYRNNILIEQGVNTIYYTDNNLSSGTYSYQVSAVYQGVESPKSNTAQAVIVPQPPTGAINGLFSVSATRQVWFSQGNLQYIGSSQTWKFADTQWQIIGTSQGNSSQNATRDLFGWGTSGWNNGNIYFQPYDTETNGNPNQGYGYGPTDGTYYSYNLTGIYANADWGVSYAGNQTGIWRTLTKEEWEFVFNTRSASTVNGIANARYVKAKVNNVCGVVLFPDSYTHPSGTPVPVHINNSEVNFSLNIWSGTAWMEMQESGCVFLPAAGYRSGTSIYDEGSRGYYWSASCGFSSDQACYVYFYFYNLIPQTYSVRNAGRSVRLVRDVQ